MYLRSFPKVTLTRSAKTVKNVKLWNVRERLIDVMDRAVTMVMMTS